MSSKKSKNTFSNPERWLVSYADYSTLLFAFFTVLYALSEIDLEKTKKFEDSLKKYFIKYGKPSGGDFTNEGSNFNSVLAPPIKTLSDSRNEKTQKTLKDVETYLESKLSSEELQKKIKDIGKEELGVRISIASSLLFENSSSTFTKDATSIIEKIGTWMQKTKYKILIESHTEESLNSDHPFYRSLWDLTSMRSSKIVRYLIDQKNIKDSRLISVGYGSSRPVVFIQSPTLRERNNRVDFLILTEDSPF